MNATLLVSLFRAALRGVDPEAAVRGALARRDVARALGGARRTGIFAAGKAAAGMLRGARTVAGARLAVLPAGYPARGIAPRDLLFASHPEPDASSRRAARRAMEFFRGFGEGDVILCLISGGASSLVAAPRPGWTLAAKRRAVAALAKRGASILELNRLRTSLSAVKGGRLGRQTRARLVTLVVSDVPGDRPRVVGSGPTIRGRRGDLVRVIASNRQGLDAAARAARRRGWRIVRRPRRLSGEARRAGFALARAARRLPGRTILLAGGETVVRLGPRRGRGGRCVELALAAAFGLRGRRGLSLLAAGSDGVDGSSRGAGAFVDGGTLARAEQRGLDGADALRRHDAGGFFAAAGGLFVTGPTGGNVADWVFLARNRRPRGPI